MSIEQRAVIDAIGTAADGHCVLTIFDHLSWDDHNHLRMLQDKINDYLGFIQSGQLVEFRPDAIGCQLEIQVICQFYPRLEMAVRFLEEAKDTLQAAQIGFSYMELPKKE